MGKAAENEKLKLKAAFYNNIASGFFLAAFVIPLIALMQKSGELGWKGEPFLEMVKMLIAGQIILIFTGLFAIFAAWLFHRMANAELDKLSD